MPDSTHPSLIVTIDGPAGSGKSTVARTRAQRLNVDFLDTGAMYRGVAAAAIDAGVDPADVDAIAEFVPQLTLRFNWHEDPPVLIVEGRPLTQRLRDADVTRAVSDVAANPAVRDLLVRAQRRIGHDHPKLVTEGRDQGSVVFPEAPVKFYLDAKPEVRAQRRADQLRAMDRPADPQVILEQIVYRDQRDKSRADGPLICPDDAAVIDTSDMTLDQVIDELERRCRACDGVAR